MNIGITVYPTYGGSGIVPNSAKNLLHADTLFTSFRQLCQHD